MVQQFKKIPVNVDEFIQIKVFIKSESFYHDLHIIQTDIERLKLMFEAIEKYHIDYDEYVFRIYFEACLWMYKIKVKFTFSFIHKCYISLFFIKETRTIMKKKLIEIKPKFKAVLEQQKAKIQLQFQNLKKEIELCTNYHDLSNISLYVNNTKSVYNQLTELNETAKSLNFQENFLNYELSDFKSKEIILKKALKLKIRLCFVCFFVLFKINIYFFHIYSFIYEIETTKT